MSNIHANEWMSEWTSERKKSSKKHEKIGRREKTVKASRVSHWNWVRFEWRYGGVGKVRESIKSDYIAARNLQDNFKSLKSDCIQCVCVAFLSHFSHHRFSPTNIGSQRVQTMAMPMATATTAARFNGCSWRPMRIYGMSDKMIFSLASNKQFGLRSKNLSRSGGKPKWDVLIL